MSFKYSNFFIIISMLKCFIVNQNLLNISKLNNYH